MPPSNGNGNGNGNGERVILQISSMVPPSRFGGAERVVKAFAEELEVAGFTVHNQGLRPRSARSEPGLPIANVFWPFDGTRRGVIERAVWHAVDVGTLASYRQVDALVDRYKPDVLVTHNLRGWGFAPWKVARKRGIPLIHVVHDYGLLCSSSTMWHGEKECGIDCRLRSRAARRRWPGGYVVGVSSAVLQPHLKRVFDASDTVTDVVYPLDAAHASDTISTPIAGPPRVLGYLGRVTADKGIDLLVDAVAHTDIQLVVAGDGDAREVADLKSRSCANVTWRGWSEPAELFKEVDALVVPSVWNEPFGLVVAEAAAAGVPVLLADRPGLVEAAEVSGARHATFHAGNISDLKRAIAMPLSNYSSLSACYARGGFTDILTKVLGVMHQ